MKYSWHWLRISGAINTKIYENSTASCVITYTRPMIRAFIIAALLIAFPALDAGKQSLILNSREDHHCQLPSICVVFSALL